MRVVLARLFTCQCHRHDELVTMLLTDALHNKCMLREGGFWLGRDRDRDGGKGFPRHRVLCAP